MEVDEMAMAGVHRPFWAAGTSRFWRDALTARGDWTRRILPVADDFA
jgi:hypothetical protein